VLQVTDNSIVAVMKLVVADNVDVCIGLL